MAYDTLHNTKPDSTTLRAAEGDVIDMRFYVNRIQTSNANEFYLRINETPELGTAFAMTSLQLKVCRLDRRVLKEWISGASPSDIVITGTGEFHLFDDEGFLEYGLFEYDLRYDNGAGWFTISRGHFNVNKQL